MVSSGFDEISEGLHKLPLVFLNVILPKIIETLSYSKFSIKGAFSSKHQEGVFPSIHCVSESGLWNVLALNNG